jgi:nucleotide-binding universal stress UspA family protein
MFTEAALFYSGRPIILVPRNYTGEFSTNRVLIAWDGSQHAASAVAHAMPLLLLANKVEILVVGDTDKAERTRVTRLITNLQRHGIDVDLIRRDDDDDANAIAQEATAWNASLLVMGGYGHSKAREMFFGGVTRFMMQKAPIPVLMAH